MERNSWLIEYKAQLENERDIWEKSERILHKTRSIYKAPNFLKNHNRDAFRPEIVSFGPYHHGKEQVNDMENLKKRAVLHFVKATRRSFEFYRNFLGEMEYVLRNHYEQLDPKWHDRDIFLNLMFVDGCFMLEILLYFHQCNLESSPESSFDRYVKSSIFRPEHKYILDRITRDMLLIENQLPLQVLVSLALAGFRKVGDRRVDKFIEECIRLFLKKPLWWLNQQGNESEPYLHLHILDMYLDSVLRTRSEPNNVYPSHEMMHSATKLDDVGIKFEKSNSRWLDDMRFNKEKGVLKFPQMTIYSVTESIFFNLMAYELFRFRDKLHVRSYVSLFMSVVHTPEDVILLQSMDIITNSLGSEEDAVKMFNTLSRAVRSISVEKQNGQGCHVMEVNEYYRHQMTACRRRLREWVRYLHITYFKNPWTFLSVLLGAILLTLTLLQTIYTMLSFYHV